MATMTMKGAAGGAALGYQPKKLLKLPKEVPSNIVSTVTLHTNVDCN